MTNDLRSVIDTGVVVSALLLPRSVPRQAFDAAARGRLQVSEAPTCELDEALRRPEYMTSPWARPNDNDLAQVHRGEDESLGHALRRTGRR